MGISERAAFGYLRARIMARHSRRLSDEQWQQLENCRGLEAFLQLARQTNLNPWVRHFEPGDDPRRWEASLRRDWQTSLKQLSNWTPKRWSEVLRWTALLPSLPAIARMLDNPPAPGWVQDDGFLSQFDSRDTHGFRDSLATSAWQRLLVYWGGTQPLQAWWLAWQDCWPPGPPNRLQRLEPARKLLAAPDGLRPGKLEQCLNRILRDQHSDILGVIAHLGILSLDLGRLRTNLLQRRVRTAQGSEGA
jgi:hypothetical protein